MIGAVIVVVAGCGGGGGETLSVVATAKGQHISTLDLGPKGKSGGDVYVFDDPLVDSEGKSVGRVYGTQTSISLDSDSETVQAMITYDFEHGDRITVGGIGQYPRGDVGLAENQEFERPILGGTGRYADASGTVTSVRRADGSYEHTFEIDD